MQLSSLRTQATSPDPGRRFIDCLIGQDSQVNLFVFVMSLREKPLAFCVIMLSGLSGTIQSSNNYFLDVNRFEFAMQRNLQLQ